MYSQNEEERYILAAVGHLKHGRLLDIGAFEPEALSNSRALILLGWAGVLIEPSTRPYLKLLEAYGLEPRLELIQAAVVLEAGVTDVEMHISPTAFSTTEDGNYTKWKSYVHELGDTGFDDRVLIPAVNLDVILNLYGRFDFISLDTEGTSVDLLHRVLALPNPPSAICVEYDDRVDEALKASTARGYHCTYRSAENLVLVL